MRYRPPRSRVTHIVTRARVVSLRSRSRKIAPTVASIDRSMSRRRLASSRTVSPRGHHHHRAPARVSSRRPRLRPRPRRAPVRGDPREGIARIARDGTIRKTRRRHAGAAGSAMRARISLCAMRALCVRRASRVASCATRTMSSTRVRSSRRTRRRVTTIDDDDHRRSHPHPRPRPRPPEGRACTWLNPT